MLRDIFGVQDWDLTESCCIPCRARNKEQLEALKKHHEEEITHHKEEIERLQKEIERHKKKIKHLKHDD